MPSTPKNMMQRYLFLQRFTIGVLFILIAACSNWTPAKCGDGTICPPDFICSDDKTTCISQKHPCGNGKIDPGEICDDGNVKSGDGCSWNCQAPTNCGNGVKDPGELCDPAENPMCLPDCSFLGTCGNGRLDPDEECEVEENSMDDKCISCQLRWCGNGRTDPDEACDPSDLASELAMTCNAQCTSTQVCGNGVIDPNEACDDGNHRSGDGCRSDCLSNETCGNGVLDHDVDEQCDSGGMNSDFFGLCRTDCQLHCGDGQLNTEEIAKCDSGQSPVLHRFCTDYGFHMGSLECDDECEPKTTQCQNVAWASTQPPTEVQPWKIWGIARGDLRIFSESGDVYSYTRVPNGVWVYENIGPDQNKKHPISDIWGAANTLYSVGEDGSVQRYRKDENPSWKSRDVAWEEGRIEKDLLGVWGAPPILYAVGEAGAIIRSDVGDDWTDTSIQTNEHLLDVWGADVSPTRKIFFAVGQSGTILYVYENYDADKSLWLASNWAPMASPTPNTLTAVWGLIDPTIDSIFLVAVGEAGTILHYHGYINPSGQLTGTWMQQFSPTEAKLSSVWGKGMTDIYIAGHNGTILHYDGRIWTPVQPEVPLNMPQPADMAFRSLWIASGSDENALFITNETGHINLITPIPRE